MAGEYDAEWIEFAKAVGRIDAPTDLEKRQPVFNYTLIQASKTLPPTSVGIKTNDEQVSPEVRVRIYHPPRALETEQLPLIVFCHGGGWIAGNLETEDHMCRDLCGSINCIVVSVDYRVYPTASFPMPIDDCYVAYQWAYTNAQVLGADPKRFLITGGSAGGALALSVAYKLVTGGHRERISGMVLLSPMCLWPDSTPEPYKRLNRSYIENGGDDVPIVTWADCIMVYEALDALPPYHGERSSWFPLVLGPDALKDIPPTYIFNTDMECLRDDGAIVEAELKDAGVRVKRDLTHGFPHYFWVLPIAKAGKLFRQKLLDGIRWVLEGE